MPKIIKKEELDKFTALGLVPRKDTPKQIIVTPEKVDLLHQDIHEQQFQQVIL